MKNFPIEKYNFHQFKNENGGTTIVARTTYAGKTVKGYAKCHPEDTFDLEKGKELAAARCALKVAVKRRKRAAERYLEAAEIVKEANDYWTAMRKYFYDADDQVDDMAENLRNIVSKMK